MNIWRIFTPTEFLLLIAKGIPVLHKLDDFYWLLFEKSMWYMQARWIALKPTLVHMATESLDWFPWIANSTPPLDRMQPTTH